MIYTGDFVLRYYVGFSQIRSQLKFQQCFNLLTCVQYILSTWFLDGSTSILVFIVHLMLLYKVCSKWIVKNCNIKNWCYSDLAYIIITKVWK